jgi:hypothetical protein
MIEIIPALPNDVLGFSASGTVTAADYESTLIPAIDDAIAGGRKAKFLYVLGDDFEGYAADAALDDVKLGANTWGDFEKIAFVTDHSVYRSMVRGFGFLMPGEVRVYPMAELEVAKDWLGS